MKYELSINPWFWRYGSVPKIGDTLLVGKKLLSVVEVCISDLVYYAEEILHITKSR